MVKSTLEELSASLDVGSLHTIPCPLYSFGQVDNAVQELADITATPEQQSKILMDRIGASCDIKKEQRLAHFEVVPIVLHYLLDYYTGISQALWWSGEGYLGSEGSREGFGRVC